MFLVDTSVWVDHLRAGDPTLVARLEAAQVLVHPFVLGELALGNLRQRRVVLEALADLPAAVTADDPEVLALIESRQLSGRGIGYVDTHLLASTLLTPGCRLWTRDRRLKVVADALALSPPD